MDKPINVGDLVMVIRPTTCCGFTCKYGFTFTVTAINCNPTHCSRCGAIDTDIPAAQAPNGDWCELSRLKRIPPPSTLDHFRSEELLLQHERP